MDSRKRNANGTFQKGQPPPVEAHRQRGVQNRITKDIKEGAIAGFARHGSNGRGEGGFSGFCYYLAKKHPKAAARIVEKLLPLQIAGNGLGRSAIGQINIVSVPVDHYLSPEDVRKLAPEPPLIEHDPQSEQLEPDFEHPQPVDPEPEPEPGIIVIDARRRR
jgi:hypothetical protein